MKAALPSTDRLAEVARLGALLAEQVIAAKGMASADQAVALAQAARLLQDHDVDWPPMLKQAIYELAELEPASSLPNRTPEQPSLEGVVISLSRFAARARSQPR